MELMSGLMTLMKIVSLISSSRSLSHSPSLIGLVSVPRLGEYLSHWGIDIMKLEKTERTLGEEEVAKNKGYNWNQILDQGSRLQLVSRPGCIGLTNIGSSCYMNVILQTLFSVDEVGLSSLSSPVLSSHVPCVQFQERYYHHAQDILNTSFPTQDPTQDPFIQISKVACALLSPRYVLPDAYLAQADNDNPDPSAAVLFDDQYAIAPRMFKALIAKDSRDFSSSKQQDASEYFQYLLKQIHKYERVGLHTRFNLGSGHVAIKETPSVFEYEMEERYQCQVTHQVKYISGKQTMTNIWELPIPLDEAINQHEVAQFQERKRKLDESQSPQDGTVSVRTTETSDEEVKLIVPFLSCVNAFFAPSLIEFRNPSLSSFGSMTPATKTLRFNTFPKYLMVKLGRYYVDSTWVMRKIDAEVPVPEFLDLSAWKGAGGLQPGELPMPETGSSSNVGTTAVAQVPVANQDIVDQLTAMGFSVNGSKRAALATQNVSADLAMNWVFEHMEDPDFNDPPAESAPTAVGSSASGGATVLDEDAVMLLTALGYSESQCRAALSATDNNPER
jgi:ubiquitin carboxyl-terminal hydrolase 5/13